MILLNFSHLLTPESHLANRLAGEGNAFAYPQGNRNPESSRKCGMPRAGDGRCESREVRPGRRRREMWSGGRGQRLRPPDKISVQVLNNPLMTKTVRHGIIITVDTM